MNKSATRLLKLTNCANNDSESKIEERIFILENTRQAARMSEGLQPFFENILSTITPYETKLNNEGDESIWIFRGETIIEWSTMIIVTDEAVLYLAVFMNQKLVEDDLLDIAWNAVERLKDAQVP